MKITHCKLKKEVQKEPLRSLYRKLPPVLPPIFWVSIPIRRHCFTVKSARLPTIVWPWLPMRFSRAPPDRAEAVSADGVKADAVAARQEKRLFFGIPKRNGRAYTVAADNAEPETLLPAVKKKIMPDGIVYADSPGSRGKSDAAFYPLPHQPFQGICRPSEPH